MKNMALHRAILLRLPISRLFTLSNDFTLISSNELLHHLVGYTLFYFLGWHDRFGFPAVALMLMASFVIIYLIPRVLPSPVRAVHRVLG